MWHVNTKTSDTHKSAVFGWRTQPWPAERKRQPNWALGVDLEMAISSSDMSTGMSAKSGVLR